MGSKLCSLNQIKVAYPKKNSMSPGYSPAESPFFMAESNKTIIFHGEFHCVFLLKPIFFTIAAISSAWQPPDPQKLAAAAKRNAMSYGVIWEWAETLLPYWRESTSSFTGYLRVGCQGFDAHSHLGIQPENWQVKKLIGWLCALSCLDHWISQTYISQFESDHLSIAENKWKIENVFDTKTRPAKIYEGASSPTASSWIVLHYRLARQMYLYIQFKNTTRTCQLIHHQ